MSEVHKFTFDGYPAVKVNGVAYVRADSLEAMGYVKVVRCKDCKFWAGQIDWVKWCCGRMEVGTQIQNRTDSAHYCAYGEPKEAGE